MRSYKFTTKVKMASYDGYRWKRGRWQTPDKRCPFNEIIHLCSGFWLHACVSPIHSLVLNQMQGNYYSSNRILWECETKQFGKFSLRFDKIGGYQQKLTRKVKSLTMTPEIVHAYMEDLGRSLLKTSYGRWIRKRIGIRGTESSGNLRLRFGKLVKGRCRRLKKLAKPEVWTPDNQTKRWREDFYGWFKARAFLTALTHFISATHPIHLSFEDCKWRLSNGLEYLQVFYDNCAPCLREEIWKKYLQVVRKHNRKLKMKYA